VKSSSVVYYELTSETRSGTVGRSEPNLAKMFPPPSLCIITFSFFCLGKDCPFPEGIYILKAMLVDSEDTLFWVLWNSLYNCHAASPSMVCDIPVAFILCYYILYFLQNVSFKDFHSSNNRCHSYCTVHHNFISHVLIYQIAHFICF